MPACPGILLEVAERQLLDDDDLHASAVVANCSMNRERQLAGVNSYTRELGFDPLDVLRAAIAGGGTGAWLDLCCGTGRALIQAATALREEGLLPRAVITGVDLVDAFAPRPAGLPGLQLVSSPVCAWTPSRSFDLITCVHGLHYVGDKLAALARAASWLTPDGLLVADLDLTGISIAGQLATRRLAAHASTTPGSPMTPGATGSPARGGWRSRCLTGTSARMTAPAPTTLGRPP